MALLWLWLSSYIILCMNVSMYLCIDSVHGCSFKSHELMCLFDTLVTLTIFYGVEMWGYI